MTEKQHQFAPFRLDPVNQCLWRDAEQISLSPKAFSVLLYLVERPRRLVTKQELLDAVWPDIHVTEGVLKRAVLEIRKVLGDPVEAPRYIQTLHRRGYRFLAAAEEPTAQAAEVPDHGAVVGRARELDQLDVWFDEAARSSRQVVFISGEAGLGKTTLVDHWMHSLRQRRPAGERAAVVIARGRCLQQFGSGEPYLPVFEALDQLSQQLGRRLVEVLRARAPTWLLHMPALISLEDRSKLRDEVFGSTRERMLREITDALELLSAEMPLVIALEDLHWSDPSTIDLVTSVARRTTPARLMMLATYRPADAGSGTSPLLRAQHELELHRQCKVLPLAYLLEPAISEYLTARFPKMESPAGLAAALHKRTNGNPLYVVCLVDELERTGRIGADTETIREMVPETLQQMFERQADQRTEPEQEMLDVAATAGECFSVAAIATAMGGDGTQVESLCEALVRRQIILKRWELVRFPDGSESPGYCFLHALCRDALYRRVPMGRRARLHGRLGRAREQLFASDPKRMAGQLAGHFELAGEFPRAIQYFRIAAEGAAERNSNEEAARYLERAFAMVERLQHADQAGPRMDLLEQRALMRLAASDMPAAAADFRKLAEQARLAGATDRQIRALLDSVLPLLLVDYKQTLAAIDEAQAVQSVAPDPIVGDIIDLYRAFFPMYMSGWNRQLADLLHRAAPKVAALADLRMRSRAAWMQAAVHVLTAEYAAACDRAEASRQDARRAGAAFEYFAATVYLNWALFHRGDLGQALRICKEGIELASRNGSSYPLLWLTVRKAWIHLEACDFESVFPMLERNAADARISAPRHSNPLFLWLGWARLGNGDYEGAWEALEKLRLAIEDGDQPFQIRFPHLQAQAECAIARKDLAHAKTLAQTLVQLAGEHQEPSYVARGYRLLAEISSLEKDFQTAAEHVSRALAMLKTCEAWNVEWQVHATAAHVFSRLGRHSESEASWQHGRRVAQRVAATLADEPALQQSFLKRVARDLPDAQATSA